MLLRSYGFAVHDLGVDVAATEVASRTSLELQPDIVGLSGLLTVPAHQGMTDTVAEAPKRRSARSSAALSR